MCTLPPSTHTRSTLSVSRRRPVEAARSVPPPPGDDQPGAVFAVFWPARFHVRVHGYIAAALREMVRGCCYCRCRRYCCCCWCVQSTPVKPRAVRSIEARGYYYAFLGGGHPPPSPSFSLYWCLGRSRYPDQSVLRLFRAREQRGSRVANYSICLRGECWISWISCEILMGWKGRIFRMINCIISFKEEIYLYLYKASHVNLRMD